MKTDIMDTYQSLSDAQIIARIHQIKSKLGADLCILGHYYQQDEVIDFADHIGDSFALAKAGANTSSKYIVFCGVHFMAEASVILAKEGQRVFLPDMDAGCPLADFATITDVNAAWQTIQNQAPNQFIPICYMNSSADIKAFCGQHGGAVCTSSSAKSIFKWVFDQGKSIFFLPDENLGRNTAIACGISETRIMTWASQCRISDVDVIVWKGYCHVHTLFCADHMACMRNKYPNASIYVHPECQPEIVQAADGNGSTGYLKQMVDDASAGDTVIIGTEIHMVSRLAKMHRDKIILPLARSLCPNMAKTSMRDLCMTLDHIGEMNEIFVDECIMVNAKSALDRMLAIGS